MTSPRVLAVGIATLDIINNVACMPAEDEEVRALAQRKQRGGNATNTLVVLAMLGWHTSWAGVLPRGNDSDFVVCDLQLNKVAMQHVVFVPNGILPTSYITLNEQNGSRTIVHLRDLPEYQAEWFAQVDLGQFDWLHFEGRAIDQLGQMLERASAFPLTVSLEVEKPREGIEALFTLPDVLLFSRHYANSRGFFNAKEFLNAVCLQVKAEALLFCAWGSEGAWMKLPDGEILFAAAHSEEAVIDTIGAGDTFNAAVIDGLYRKLPAADVLSQACRVAGIRCCQAGFGGLRAVLDALPAD